MEVFWTVPLYFIIPVIGIILIITGLYNFFEHRVGLGKIILGLGLLSIPFLHSLMIENNEYEIEQATPGNYFMKSDSSEVVLILNKNKTFKLTKIDSLIDYGNGTWEIHHWDIDQLTLLLQNNKSIIFEIIENNGDVTLRYNPWSNKNIDLIKK